MVVTEVNGEEVVEMEALGEAHSFTLQDLQYYLEIDKDTMEVFQVLLFLRVMDLVAEEVLVGLAAFHQSLVAEVVVMGYQAQ